MSRGNQAAQRRRYDARLKRQAMLAYGGRCSCCGEDELIFLTIDHLDNSGAEHRRILGRGGARLYQWLKARGYPEGFQVLCFNCNFAKSNGGCPHAR